MFLTKLPLLAEFKSSTASTVSPITSSSPLLSMQVLQSYRHTRGSLTGLYYSVPTAYYTGGSGPAPLIYTLACSPIVPCIPAQQIVPCVGIHTLQHGFSRVGQAVQPLLEGTDTDCVLHNVPGGSTTFAVRRRRMNLFTECCTLPVSPCNQNPLF